ncbi:MAG: YebC/PmpR family DNA-binding transcriptional regulator [bacterium]
MSGHSKWDTIHRDKAINDSKKGAAFTKLSKEITIAAKVGGGDTAANATLYTAVTKAKALNMSNDKIQRAIDKGTGVTRSGIAMNQVSYEAYGPGEVGMIIDAATENNNRTFSEVKSIVEKAGGRIVEGGAVSWFFESKGWLYIPFENEEEKKKRENQKWGAKDDAIKLSKTKWEEFELELMDQDGVFDIQPDDLGITVYTSPESVGKIRKFVEENKIYVDDSEVIKKSKNEVNVDDDVVLEKMQQLIEKLEDNDDVEKVWTAIS